MAKTKPTAPPEEAAAAEGYTVLARRYRPQQFGDLIGQEPVARALGNALKSNRVAHAYLFTGARGVGKTSTARILAKALNCVEGPTATPCDQCDACRGITSGEDVDVLEIDGASNRGIDDVREIRSNVQYRPSRSRFKIYIIDEVHMLSKDAFNALLKTLEEPPAHVKFIFATTDAQKIPITVLSRCQRFDFAGIGSKKIVEHLRGIVRREKMEADDEALELVARRAGGSMRDAQSLLDQLLAFGSERLTTEQVHQLLGTAHDDRVAELAAAVLGHDARRALELLAMAAEEGAQLGELLDQLIAYWRDLMVVSCAGVEGPDVSVPPRHREALTGQARQLALDTVLAGLDVLSSTKARLQRSGHGRTLFEMALVRLARLEDLVSVAQLAQQLAQGKGAEVAETPARKSGEATQGPIRTRLSGSLPVEPPESVKKKPIVASDSPAPSTTALAEETLPQVWQEVLTQIGPMARGELQKIGIPAISGPNTLVLGLPAQYNPLCQSPTTLARIEDALKRLTGQTWQVRTEVRGGMPTSGQTEAPVEPTSSSPRSKRQRDEALQEPHFRRAIDLFDAQIVRVDDGFGAAPVAPAGGEQGPDEMAIDPEADNEEL